MKLENLLLSDATRVSRAPGREMDVMHDVLKLADFGFASRLKYYQVAERVDNSLAPFAPCHEVFSCGSLGYMPYEVIEKRPVQPLTVDVFAMGACLYAMVCPSPCVAATIRGGRIIL